jgi:hypothetical protein
MGTKVTAIEADGRTVELARACAGLDFHYDAGGIPEVTLRMATHGSDADLEGFLRRVDLRGDVEVLRRELSGAAAIDAVVEAMEGISFEAAAEIVARLAAAGLVIARQRSADG